MPVSRRAASLALIAFVAGCSRHFEVPEPTPAGAAQTVQPIEAATIAVPVTIAMSSIKARIDSVFPVSDSLDRAKCSAIGGLVCHQYVYRRDTLDLKMFNDRITLFTRLRFRARVALPGGVGVASCGYAPESMKRAEMRLATNLYWRADWRLGSRGTVLAPDILDPCEVTVLRVDATPTIKRMIEGQLSHVRQQFDPIVPALANLKPVADSMWQMLQRPVAMDSASTIWLAMTPDSARLGAPVGTGSAVTTSLMLTARPRVVVGARPLVETRPLPMLTLAGNSSGVHVPLEIEVPFDELSRRATALLSGEVAGKGITVFDIKVWGVGDTAVVRVDIDGRVSGALYLLGRVGYDTASRAVLIEDLRYTIASASKMSSIKATLGALRIRHALDEATGHGRLAVGDQLDRVKADLGAQLNRELAPRVQLTGGLTDVVIDRLYTTATAFVLRVVFDGEARVNVR
ncbi:MAG TPA: DUF4403 family protein [Gemmatimonadaceae bacterium]|jgi:hypothetical protein|nr:DUF4403 family protein [Gemmatimonadaceae bacterium]